MQIGDFFCAGKSERKHLDGRVDAAQNVPGLMSFPKLSERRAELDGAVLNLASPRDTS